MFSTLFCSFCVPKCEICIERRYSIAPEVQLSLSFGFNCGHSIHFNKNIELSDIVRAAKFRCSRDILANCFLTNLLNAIGWVQVSAFVCLLWDLGCWCPMVRWFTWQSIYSKEKSLAQNSKLMLREGMAKLVWLFFVERRVSGLGGDLVVIALLVFACVSCVSCCW